jgi:CelD/BcsL family acetyltransferase involved in cellulose biosynthesis
MTATLTRTGTDLVTTHAGLAAVAAEWDDLHARAVGVTPFQTHAWVTSWAEQYVPAGRLRVLLVRRDGRLVAAAPLWLAYRGAVRVLAPLGGGASDHHDVLLDAGDPAAAADLAAALTALPSWDVLDLAEVRAGAGAEALAAAWRGPRWRSRGSRCLELPVPSLAAFVAGTPKHTAKTLKRKLRKIEQAPITARTVPAAEVPAAVGDLLRLHRNQWSGRAVSAEHLRPRFERHLVGALTRMVEADQAVLREYTCHGQVVVVDLEVIGSDYVGTYLAGFDPAMREYVDIAVLMLSEVFGEVERRGLGTLNLLRGDEPYKLHWRPTPARNGRLLLGRGPVSAGYAAAVLARAAAADAGRERYPRLRAYRSQLRSVLGRLR